MFFPSQWVKYIGILQNMSAVERELNDITARMRRLYTGKVQSASSFAWCVAGLLVMALVALAVYFAYDERQEEVEQETKALEGMKQESRHLRGELSI